MKRLHEKVILELARKLQTDNPDANIVANSKFRKNHHRVPDMPQGWRGVNVFTVDIWQKDEVYVWSPDGEFIQLNKGDWRSVR